MWFLQNDMNMRNTCKFYMVITSWCNLYLMRYYWKSPYIYHLFECFRIIFQLFLSTIATFPTACYYFTIIYQYYYNILRGHLFNPFTARFLKYVWPFYNIMDEGVNAYTKFSEKLTFLAPLIRTRTCTYQGIRDASFLENFSYVLNEWFLKVVTSNLSRYPILTYFSPVFYFI